MNKRHNDICTAQHILSLSCTQYHYSNTLHLKSNCAFKSDYCCCCFTLLSKTDFSIFLHTNIQRHLYLTPLHNKKNLYYLFIFFFYFQLQNQNK